MSYAPFERGYSTVEVARRTGVSFRQLNYWRITGLIHPSIRDARGSGTQCTWDEEDVNTIALIVVLLDAGVSLQAVRRAGPRQMAEKLAAWRLPEEVAS